MKQRISRQPVQHHQRREHGGNISGGGDACDAHTERDHKKQIEYNICSSRNDQRKKWIPAVAARPQYGSAEVVQQQKRITHHIDPQIKLCGIKNAFWRLDQPQQRRCGRLSQKRSGHACQNRQKRGRLYCNGHLLCFISANILRDQDIGADG